MPGNTWLIWSERPALWHLVVCHAGHFGGSKNTCVGMNSAAPAMSKTIAARAPAAGSACRAARTVSASARSLFSAWSAGRSASIRACSSTARKFFPAAAKSCSRAVRPVDDARTAETKDFVAAVLGDTEDRWTGIFSGMGRTYHPPRLRLSRGRSTAAVAWRNRPWGRSTARRIRTSISICRSSRTCRTNSMPARATRPANSPRPM